MGIWDILGIERTNDIKKIKGAYAKKLKVTHPEDDAEAFQRLKEAFDKAKVYAKNNKNQINIEKEREENNYEVQQSQFFDKKESFEIETNIEDEERGNIEIKIRNDDEDEERKEILEHIEIKVRDEEEIVVNFDRYVNDNLGNLMLNLEARNSIKPWKEFLEVALKNIDIEMHMKLEKILAEFIYEEYMLISPEILKYIVDKFNVIENIKEIEFKYTIDDVFLEYVKNPIELSFDQISKCENLSIGEIDKFLLLRFKAYKAKRDRNIQDSKMYIIQSEKIFNEDDDIKALKLWYVFLDNNLSLEKRKDIFKSKYDSEAFKNTKSSNFKAIEFLTINILTIEGVFENIQVEIHNLQLMDKAEFKFPKARYNTLLFNYYHVNGLEEKMYELYIEYKDDILKNRYTRNLAKKMLKNRKKKEELKEFGEYRSYKNKKILAIVILGLIIVQSCILYFGTGFKKLSKDNLGEAYKMAKEIKIPLDNVETVKGYFYKKDDGTYEKMTKLEQVQEDIDGEKKIDYNNLFKVLKIDTGKARINMIIMAIDELFITKKEVPLYTEGIVEKTPEVIGEEGQKILNEEYTLVLPEIEKSDIKGSMIEKAKNMIIADIIILIIVWIVLCRRGKKKKVKAQGV